MVRRATRRLHPLMCPLIRLLLFRSSARIYKMRTALPCVLYTMQVRLCMRALMLAMSYPMHRHCQSRAQIRLLWRSALRLWVVKPLPTAVWSARFAFEQQPRFLARKFGWCVLNSVEAGDLRPSCLIFALRCKGHPHPPTFLYHWMWMVAQVIKPLLLSLYLPMKSLPFRYSAQIF